LLGSRLATVATHAQALTIGNVVSLTALAHGHDVIGVCLAVIAAHATAGTAGPCVTGQHRLPPRSMRAVTVAASRSGGALALVTPWAAGQAGRLV
jgi:hypothetical protein